MKISALKLGNEWFVVPGSLQSRFTLYTDEGSVCSLQSGLGTKVLQPAIVKIKYNCGHLAPCPSRRAVEALTLQQRGTRKRSVKAEDGKNPGVVYKHCAPIKINICVSIVKTQIPLG
jgi:hypothetical protein